MKNFLPSKLSLFLSYIRLYPQLLGLDSIYIGQKFFDLILLLLLSPYFSTIKFDFNSLLIGSWIFSIFGLTLCIGNIAFLFGIELIFKIIFALIVFNIFRINKYIFIGSSQKLIKYYCFLCILIFIFYNFGPTSDIIDLIWDQEKSRIYGHSLFRNVFISANPNWSAFSSICIFSLAILTNAPLYLIGISFFLIFFTFSKTGIIALVIGSLLSLLKLISIGFFQILINLKISKKNFKIFSFFITLIISFIIFSSFIFSFSRYHLTVILKLFTTLITGELPVKNIPTLSGRLQLFNDALGNISLLGSNQGLEFNQAFDSSLTMILRLSGYLGLVITISVICILIFKNSKYFGSSIFNIYYPKILLFVSILFFSLSSDFINNTSMLIPASATLAIFSNRDK